MLGYRGEEIVFAGVEDGAVCGGAGGDDADDFAANDFFAGAGLLHLVADGDFEAGADQAGDVAVGGVVRNAAHGDRLTFFAIAGSERDLEFFARQGWRLRRRVRRNRRGERGAAREGSAI